MPLTDDQVVKLLPALEEAARADPERAPARFVPPRTGILEQTAAQRHQFVFGRRGVGKSTLLLKIQRDHEQFKANVLFIDVETLKGRPYPDVLIELLIDLLGAFRRRLPVKPTRDLALWTKALRARWRVRPLERALRSLLAEPQQAQHTVRKLQKSSRGAYLGLDTRLYRTLRGGGSLESARSHEREAHAEFTQTKMEGLLAAAVEIRKVLKRASEQFNETPTLIVLDDFYHVPYDDQPLVLGYLHQVVKNLPIYLKICGVRHRVKPYVEGHPPTGLQLTHDAGEISLDITLEQFHAAQIFLEQVLNGVAGPAAGATAEDIATDTGRERLVLGSGGVARDYLDLVSKALRRANERPATPGRPHNRITAEDVNEAAADVSANKQDDLTRDAGPEAEALRERLTDVVRFCLDRNSTNVFLVEGTDLHESDWGKEIEALTDLRLMHGLGNLSVPWGPYRARRFVGFTLDLSHWTGTRSERIRQMEFWKPGIRRQLRRAGLVYRPGRAEAQAPRRPVDEASATTDTDPGPVDWEQPPLPFSEGDGEEAEPST